jgi:parallel beta-helix repeat protein
MKNHLFIPMAMMLLLFACLANVPTKGANYYFSTSQGDDSRTSIEAQNPTTPWKTLDKFNMISKSLKPGDSVLFKRGETFYGSITINASGTAFSPIVFGGYGTGGRSIISGFTKLTDWTPTGPGIYESSVNSNIGAAVNMVTVSGKIRQMGRYPNADAANGGYLTYQSHVGQTSISSNQISGVPNFTGGEVVIRAQRDILDRCIISDQTSTTVSYTKVSSFLPNDGYGFFFQNHISTLDQFGEWYYNQNSKKLDVYFGKAKPASYNIQVSTIDTLVKMQSKSYITFYNIAFKGANVRAIYILGGSNITVTNCAISYIGQDGIYGQKGNNIKIDKCTIERINNNGIFLQSPDGSIASNSVTNCTIRNIGLGAGLGITGTTFQGIAVFGGKNTVAYNIIDSTGYHGIKFGSGDSCLIKNNYVKNFCLVKNDGGGIYTWNNVRDANKKVIAITYHGNKITGNIIMNAGSPDAGTIYSENNIDHPIYGAHGIYCDGNSENIEVSGNTVANNGKGIFLHDNRNMILKNNTVFNNKERQLEVLYDDSTLAPVRSINVRNNIFFSKHLTQEMAGFMSLYTDDIEDFGTYDSNYHAQAINKENLIYSKYLKKGLVYSQHFDHDNWKLAYGDDQHSKTAATTLTEYTLDTLLNGNKVINGTYDVKTLGTTSINKGNTSVSSWDNSGKLDGGCYKLSYKATSTVSTTTNMVINVGEISSSKNYILRYSILGTKNNGSVGVYLRQGVAPYYALTPVKYYTVNTSRNDNEVLFSFPDSDSKGQIVFQFNDKDSTFYFDNIQLYEAAVTITNPDDYVRFEYNPSNKAKTITLDANYIGLDSTLYSGSISLAPYTSVILMKAAACSSIKNEQANNSSMLSKVTSNTIAGNSHSNRNQNLPQLKLVAFPNPSPTEFNLLIQSSSNEEVEVSLFDMNGRNVFHTRGQANQKYVFGRNLTSGIYALKVTQGENVQTLKLMK